MKTFDQQKLKEREECFRAVFEVVPIGLGIINADLEFVKVNKVLCSMLGYTCAEVCTLRYDGIFHPEDVGKVKEVIEKLNSGDSKSFQLESRFLGKDQRIGWAEFNIAVLCEQNCKPLYILVMMEDISRRKRIECDLQKRSADLEAVNKELESFSYSVAHDLRAPLRSINGFAQMLSEDYGNRLDEKGKDYLQRIIKSAADMRELIDNLLKFARVTLTEMHKGQVDLSSIVRSVFTRLSEASPHRKVKLNLPEDIMAQGNAYLLLVLMENLLNNSWKFTGLKPNPEISFGVEEKDNQRVYFLKDNGTGFVLPDVEKKLFVPFQRFHKAEEFPGVGIGLATAQRIVNRHGGRIWAESSPDVGTTIYFTLE